MHAKEMLELLRCNDKATYCFIFNSLFYTALLTLRLVLLSLSWTILLHSYPHCMSVLFFFLASCSGFCYFDLTDPRICTLEFYLYSTLNEAVSLKSGCRFRFLMDGPVAKKIFKTAWRNLERNHSQKGTHLFWVISEIINHYSIQL